VTVWKAGFGAPEAMARLGLDEPLVAELPPGGELADGATVSLAGWTKPLLEAEVAVWVGRGLGAAIELADRTFPPDDAARILAEGFYYRHVVLGPPRARTLDGVVARVFRDGVEAAATDDPTALTGPLERVLAAVERAAGRPLRSEDVVIAGAVVPPLRVEPGETWRADFGAVGAVGVAFA